MCRLSYTHDPQLKKEVFIYLTSLLFFVYTMRLLLITSPVKTEVNRNFIINQTSTHTATYKDKIVMNSIQIIEGINKNRNKSDHITISDLFKFGTQQFHEKYPKSLPRMKNLAKLKKTEMDKIWKRFNFENGTVLKSDKMTIPLIVDWREKNVTSDVKSQKSCGACWAYSTLGVIESMNAIKSGNLSDLSISQMLACNIDEMDCKGGDTVRLLRWLYEYRVNIQKESDYLLSDSDDSMCQIDKAGIRVRDFSTNNFTDNEHFMLLYLAHQGPLITCVNSINWKYYNNGIIQQNCSEDSKYMKHAVEIVGYDLTDAIPHYIVKNSWGPKYGINGYLKIAIGNNLCGIAQRVSAVVVE